MTVLVRIDLLYEIVEAETSTTQLGLVESTHQGTISSDSSAQHQDKEAKGSIFMAQCFSNSESEREQGVYFSDFFGALMTAGVEETVFYQRKAQATVHSYSKS